MSVWEACSAASIVLSLVLAGLGMAALRGWIDFARTQRWVRASTFAAQRRRARCQIRRSEPVAASEVVLVRAVATGLSSQGAFALIYLVGAVVSVAQLLVPSTPWWAAIAGTAGAGNLLIALALAYDDRQARRFLADHPGTEQQELQRADA